MRLHYQTSLISQPVAPAGMPLQTKDYVPKYHLFYDPSQAVQRVENAPVGMEPVEIKAVGDE